mmetsp:Transcript_52701/g.115530  ORF Transcript_52701/g.115530 Transcript_52701/m.115530 type:complete len:91 (+) Transcript_52701:73-345(+)
MAHSARTVVKFAEMDPDMLEFAQSTAISALENNTDEKDIASYLKREFENLYQPTWHCIVGRHFSSYVTHEKKCYCYFYIGQMGVCLWKTP